MRLKYSNTALLKLPVVCFKACCWTYKISSQVTHIIDKVKILDEPKKMKWPMFAKTVMKLSKKDSERKVI